MAKKKIAATTIAWTACVGLLAGGGVARAQCDYSLTAYPSSDLDGGGIVSAMTVFDDGSGPALIVGGMDLLEDPGGSSIDTYNIAKWSPRTGWAPLAEPNELYYVRDLQVFEDHLYAAASSDVHRWTGTGTEWISVSEGLIGSPSDMVVFDDGSGSGPSLFVMTNVHVYPPSQYSSRLLKLSGGVWQQIARFNDRFSTVEAFDGRLIVVGGFTAVNDVPVNRVAAWDGQQWSNWGGGVVWVTDLIQHQVDGAPALVACGSFMLEDKGGVPTDVAYWDGSGWHGLPEINAPNQDGIGPMAVWNDGYGEALYVAITTEEPSSGDHHDKLYRLDPFTQQWQLIAGTYYLPDSYIGCMIGYNEAVSDFPTLFVGGKFDRFGAVYTYHIARMLPQSKGGGIEPIPSDPRALRGDVQSMAMFDDGTGGGSALHACGHFRGLHHTSLTLVARFTGESWTGMGWGGYGQVSTLKVLDDGSGPALYAAGSFNNLYPNNGEPPSRIAKWDGVNWIRMGSLNSTVSAMCEHDDGSGPAIYIATDGSVRKWNPIAGTWSAIGPTLTGGGFWGPDVNALASLDDGSGPALYIAGDFETVNGVAASNIARWQHSTGDWQPVGEGLPNYVTMMHVHDDNSAARLIANGSSLANGIAQWDGQAWSAIGNLQSIGFGNSTIRAITTFDDGSGPALIVSHVNRMARWNGLFWAMLPHQGADAFAANGDVLYMGSLFSIWAPGGDELSISEQFGGGSFEPGGSTALQVNVVHGGAVTYQWRHNGSPLMNVSGYSGARTNRLNIYNINGSHEGVYDAVVSNDCTTVVSDTMEIDVIGTCVGDITADGVIDSMDLVALLIAWGSCIQYQPCAADLTHDGAVDVDDLLMVILQWGDCP